MSAVLEETALLRIPLGDAIEQNADDLPKESGTAGWNIKMRRFRNSDALLCIGLWGVVSVPASADQYHELVAARPAQDAAALAELAPPSNLSTALGAYGDAGVADRTIVRKERRRIGGRASNRAACLSLKRFCYRQYYVYTPSYVSAPQVFANAHDSPTSILSPFTDGILKAYQGLPAPDE